MVSILLRFISVDLFKVGKVKPYSPAEKAGLKPFDYIYTINGKEVFEMNHNQCVNEIKSSGKTLTLAVERWVSILNTSKYNFITVQ